MAEIFGPFQSVPKGAAVFTGGSMPVSGLPIPSITGGPAGPSQALSGNVSLGTVNFGGIGGFKLNFASTAVLVIGSLAALYVWRKVK